MSHLLHPSGIVGGTRQVESLSYEACGDAFQDTCKEVQTIVMVCEASEASVIVGLLR